MSPRKPLQNLILYIKTHIKYVFAMIHVVKIVPKRDWIRFEWMKVLRLQLRFNQINVMTYNVDAHPVVFL